MSGRKSNLTSFQNFINADMSTSLVSSITNIQFLDNVGLQLQWTSSPVGTFSAQVSYDYAQDNQGNVTNSGLWASIPLTYFNGSIWVTSLTLATSLGAPITLDLNQLSAPWIKIIYTRSSGTGTLNGYLTAKMV